MTDKVIEELQSASKWFAEHGRNTNTAIVGICDRAVDLINRQRAEIERLQEECDQAWEEHSDIQIKYDLLFDEAKALIEKTKSEAVKEFAEKMKLKMQDLARLDFGGNVVFLVGEKFIDNLVKEFTEGKKECPDCKHFVGCEAACGGRPCDCFDKGDGK